LFAVLIVAPDAPRLEWKKGGASKFANEYEMHRTAGAKHVFLLDSKFGADKMLFSFYWRNCRWRFWLQAVRAT
jgi:hypothetical protein